MNPLQSSGQLGNGLPGGFPLPQRGFPLPQRGEPGTAYTANKTHPAAAPMGVSGPAMTASPMAAPPMATASAVAK